MGWAEVKGPDDSVSLSMFLSPYLCLSLSPFLFLSLSVSQLNPIQLQKASLAPETKAYIAKAG